MLAEIKRRVEEKVKEKNKQIIMGMYQKMIRAHTGYCGCDYCNIHNEYVKERIKFSKYNKIINGPECEYDFSNVSINLLHLQSIKEKIKELKVEKEKIRTI